MVFFLTDHFSDIVNRSLQIELIARNPASTAHADSNGALYVYLRADEFGSSDPYMYFLCYGDYGLAGAASVNAPVWTSKWDERESYVDGKWHIFDFNLCINGPSTIAIDGQVVATQSEGNFFPGTLTNPYLELYMPATPSDVNYTLDSLTLAIL